MNRKSWQLVFFRLSLSLCLLFLVTAQPASGTTGVFDDASSSPEPAANLPQAIAATDPAPAYPTAIGAFGATAVAAGTRHTCELTPGGGVRCWGTNWEGELGDGTTINSGVPVDVIGLGGEVTAITLGYGHTCALLSNGGVKCWGYNEYGQLGDGTNTDRYTPVNVVGLEQGVTAIAAGWFHTCALASGEVKCWGYNISGQLSDGTTTHSSTPVDVVGLEQGVIGVAAGYHHTCAFDFDGVKCWGANEHGQLGDGTTNGSVTPVDVVGLEQGVTAITAGEIHTCALVNGGVKCWGNNEHGQLGDDTTIQSSTPVDVVGLGSGVTAVTAGTTHTCAIGPGGGAKCWGGSGLGQLGNGTTTGSSTPVDVVGLSSGVTFIAAGEDHTCAILSGWVRCWGEQMYGKLGDNVIMQRSIPIDLVGLGSSMHAITAGGWHTCTLVAGGVTCWGDNEYGQLGDGTTTQSSTPVAVVGLEQGVTEIAAGYRQACAILSGGVKCWGNNEYGQLGDGTTTNSSTPVAVVGLGSGVTAVSAGSAHTCTLLSGEVKCWGYNFSGQLGDGTTTNSSTPVDVVGLDQGVTAVTAGEDHTCALVNGGVKCWGNNAYGKLGDGTTTNRTTPVDVIGLGSGVTAVSAGSAHTCAIGPSGGARCWGANREGELGDGTFTDSSTPVDVVGLEQGVTAIAVGLYHTCAIGPNGGAKCWGDNYFGQLGDGTTHKRNTPVDVTGLSSHATAISAGGRHTCALAGAGRAKCWGWDDYGQLGLGTRTKGLTPVIVVESASPPLIIDYSTGQPGSFFTLTGWKYPTGAQASLAINGQVITTLTVNPTGSLSFFLDTSGADVGGYTITVGVFPSGGMSYQDASLALARSYTAITSITLYEDAPLRPQEGGGLVFSVLPGIALHHFVYLPVLAR